MVVIHQNCRRGYKTVVIVLEIALDIQVGIILIQELFICN